MLQRPEVRVCAALRRRKVACIAQVSFFEALFVQMIDKSININQSNIAYLVTLDK